MTATPSRNTACTTPRMAAVGENIELQTKLRVFHEHKKVTVIEDALAQVSTGRSLAADDLARHGVGHYCYVAAHLGIQPWIGCAQVPGWTQLLRTVLEEPIVVLAEDLGTVVGFLELEYPHSVFAVTT